MISAFNSYSLECKMTLGEVAENNNNAGGENF
jgi:hypothetical protein